MGSERPGKVLDVMLWRVRSLTGPTQEVLTPAFHEWLGAVSALFSTGQLSRQELDEWQRCVEREAERLRQRLGTPVGGPAPRDGDALRIARQRVQDRLEREMQRLAAVERHPERFPSAARASVSLGSACALARDFFDLGLLSNEELEHWNARFRRALHPERTLTTAIPPEVADVEWERVEREGSRLGSAPPPEYPPFSGTDLRRVFLLVPSSSSTPAGVLELYSDGVLMKFQAPREREFVPYGDLTDDVGTRYVPAEAHRAAGLVWWQLTFVPSVPTAAQELSLWLEDDVLDIRLGPARSV